MAVGVLWILYEIVTGANIMSAKTGADGASISIGKEEASVVLTKYMITYSL